MKSRGVVGKRIVEIRQDTVRETGRRAVSSVYAVVLEDGTELRPMVYEGETDYSVDLLVVKPAPGK